MTEFQILSPFWIVIYWKLNLQGGENWSLSLYKGLIKQIKWVDVKNVKDSILKCYVIWKISSSWKRYLQFNKFMFWTEQNKVKKIYDFALSKSDSILFKKRFIEINDM